MNKAPIMPWVDQLADAPATDFPARRDQIAGLMDEAAALTEQATGLLNKAAELRAKAYYAALSLEGDAKGKWGYEEVEQAKRRADW